MSFTPLHNNILVLKKEAPKVSKGGIHFGGDPETEFPPTGEVVAVGPGKYNKFNIFTECCVKKGDVILFGKTTGTVVELENVKYLIMKDDEVLGVLKTSN